MISNYSCQINNGSVLGTCTYKDLVRTNSHTCRNLGTVVLFMQRKKLYVRNRKPNKHVGTYAL